MKFAGAAMKIRVPADVAVDAEVDLCRTDDGDHFIQGRLNISLPGMEREIAQELIEAAHQRCTYSKATRGNIDVEIKLV
jgi:organic hydroperoxide reductase OsmC/OhrA